MREEVSCGDVAIARTASRQHGIVTAAQIYAAGLSRAGVTRRLRAGRLHRLYQGVYAVGHTMLSNEGRWMAAVLACGPGALLIDRSAAELWRLLKALSMPLSVGVPATGGRAKRPGIHLRYLPSLPRADMTRERGIPVLTPAATIRTLRRLGDVDDLHSAIKQAEFLHLDIGSEARRDPFVSRSALERRFNAMCNRHHLPKPEVNAMIGPHEVDFLWRQRRVIVETDGFESHGGRQAFEDDRAKDAELRVLGFTVQRFTYRQVVERWLWVERMVRALLA